MEYIATRNHKKSQCLGYVYNFVLGCLLEEQLLTTLCCF